MKIKMVCQQCFENGLLQDKEKTPPYIPAYPYWEYPVIELDKWPFIEYVCQRGHKHRLLLSFELYELLFEQATYCIMDGYYREAIGTYHAALERFFEYAIEMICTKTQTSNYEKLWKSISRQSERQLGAYYALWTATFKEMPEQLNEEKVRIRNNVVHKGVLVSKDEALSYGKYVFDYVRNAAQKLETEFGESIHTMRGLRLLRVCKRDLEKTAKNPIVINKDGQDFSQGTGTFSSPCLLNSPNIKKYEDCFSVNLGAGFGVVK